MNFLESLKQETNITTTTNGAVAFSSSLSSCLDLFIRGATAHRADEALFAKAFAEDKQTAIRVLFYLRDIRGGQGTRSIFRLSLKWLAEKHKEIFEQIVQYVPEYGRWDDIVSFYDNPVVVEMVSRQWKEDLTSSAPSLLAKWLPSHNTSSAHTRKLGRHWAKILGDADDPYRSYRKKLVRLRAALNVLEPKMTDNRWEEIDYSKLPAQALARHGRAFSRHDGEQFGAFLKQAKHGKAKINASTLYTYEVCEVLKRGNEELADTLWKNLPTYAQEDALVVADVSGSMTGRPMATAVSLALYFAERSKGTFKDTFMTFSEKPQLINIVGDTLADKIRFIETSDWGMNTNLEAVFDTILDAAVKVNAKAEELPKVIYIISDMQFGICVQKPESTLFEHAKQEFAKLGYELPTIVFWNVGEGVQNALPVTKYDKNVVLVGGRSQVIFDMVLRGKDPLEVMDEVVNSERYNNIAIA